VRVRGDVVRGRFYWRRAVDLRDVWEIGMGRWRWRFVGCWKLVLGGW
jgi:hypothetical protein